MAFSSSSPLLFVLLFFFFLFFVVGAAAAADCTTWYETTQHGPGFRNVSAYGATGNGVTDDSDAIIAALTSGRNPAFTVADPTVVYFPPGNYLISKTLPVYFYTFVVGNFRCRPTITLAQGTFATQAGYIFDSDVSDEGGQHTDEFYRGISHLNIVFLMNNPQATGIHWAQSQATSIRDVYINAGDGAAGIFGENGSGGFISDLVVEGGIIGISFGNQQWTWRNISVSGSTTACVQLFWNWAMVFENLQVSNCPTGVEFTGTAAGSLAILDSTFSHVGVGISTDFPNFVPGLVLERLTTINVPTITANLPGNAQGTTVISAWRQGPLFHQNASPEPGSQGTYPLSRPDSPIEQRPRPTFDGVSFYNVYSAGAVGDGVHDDTSAIQSAISANAAVFFPQGKYLISSTITLRTDSILVGEALSELMASGSSAIWANANAPAPLVSVPEGSNATVQLADLIFTMSGDAPGCILLSWAAGQESSAWDVHWRQEYTSWGLLLITGGGYFENMWAWVADHDIDSGATLTVYNPRGITVTPSASNFWFYSVAAEHSYMWQFNITGAQSGYVFVAQTETPYWQSPPSAWGMTVTGVQDFHMYGAGFYNWFNGEQEAVFNVDGHSEVYLFDVFVHNSSAVLVGDNTISAGDPNVQNWFCQGFSGFVPSI